MPHALMAKHEDSAVGPSPFLVTARYQCECANNKVIAINVVLDLNCPEERFVRVMRRLRQDIQREVRQHINDRPVAAPVKQRLPHFFNPGDPEVRRAAELAALLRDHLEKYRLHDLVVEGIGLVEGGR